MLTDFTRDHAFTIAWFGLMAFVWCGWAQEDPPPRWRWCLGVASGLGAILAGGFGYSVALHWDDGSALEGRYEWFGAVVGLEVLLAGAGCLVLARRSQSRWMAWWVALVVALHFIPLAFFLGDWSLALLGLMQAAALFGLLPRLRRTDEPTSRLVGPVMGASLLVFALLSCVVFVARIGSPW
ncbi:hypothetical protein OCAE111667_14185 [Occultella aeris]|uniref:Uncharacterized protein n=1 Tax=Occultella aeris TaxID=2761496 RepID=A0A7M4DIU0_9MICO|nr:hypothetical protein [Occultella aeris]VZO36903.1 hypothetical protein HALOF300_02043 [Occultella aeris]